MATDERSRVGTERLVSELDDLARQARALVAERRTRDGDTAVELVDCWFATWETLRERLHLEAVLRKETRDVNPDMHTRYVTEWRRS